MFNPLINFADFTDQQLEDRIVDLQRKYFQTQNLSVKQQLAVNLDNFKEELKTRRAIAAQRQREQMQENGDSDLDSLINIS